MQPMSASRITKAWERRGLLACLLLPVTLVYTVLQSARRCLYRWQMLKSRKVDCTVIVVGNVVAGGAGKTPTTIGIVHHLQRRGMQVGVVSRGYGRTDRSPCAVSADTAAEIAGDEPLLIARATGVPVFVAASRHEAASALLAAHPKTQAIVCDDGLQHYGLYRDIEICVFDDRGTGNGWLLPSGPLREPWPRKLLANVGQSNARQMVLHTGAHAAFKGFQATRRLADVALARDASTTRLASLQGPLLALAGIARPEVFFTFLQAAGLQLAKTLPLPDHFDFAGLDLSELQGYTVLCTEKDAGKLWKLWPQALAVPLVQTLEPAFLSALDDTVNDVVAAKLSSTHGHQTA